MNGTILAGTLLADKWVGLIAAAILGLVFMQFLSYRFFQSFQLNSYRFARYWKWLRATRGKYPLRLLLVTLLGGVSIMAVSALFAPFWGDIASYVGIGLLLAYALIYLVADYRAGRKTPLKETPRVLRMYAVYDVLSLGTLFGFTLLFDAGPYYAHGLIFAALPVLVPVLAALSMLIMSPFEAANNRRYLRKAQKAMRDFPGLTVIGITGSYAKTSIKNLLFDMLKTKHKTVKTPDSYNTPLGVSRTVLSDLTPGTEFFLCEMGARQRGDIAFLCELVRPSIGVLTGIAPQHLEYFKSMRNILDAKYELIESLPAEGFAVFNGGSTAELYDRFAGEKYLAGKDATIENAAPAEGGTSFEIRMGERVIPCFTRLLGRHNLENLAACALVLAKLDFSDEEIAAAVAGVRPVRHRLELVTQRNNIRVIDDTYNSNPVSAKAAIDTVAEYPGRKIIVTCGFVELGELQNRAHTELGGQIAGVFSEAILVGPAQTAGIREGLLQSGFDEERITVVSGLQKAQDVLRETLQPGDTVLLLNDLPDNYLEP